MEANSTGGGRERKGTMFFRSDEMNYGRAVLNSNWDQIRQADPKDYDMNRAPVRDLLRSTYNRLGTVTDPHKFPDSTYKDHFNESPFASWEPHKPMSSADDDETDSKAASRKCVLGPCTDAVVDRDHYISTMKGDFQPFTQTQSNVQAEPQQVVWKSRHEEDRDYGGAFKRCVSQFTDTSSGHQRGGRNTWLDESGIYSTAALKAGCPYYGPTYTLMPGGVKP